MGKKRALMGALAGAVMCWVWGCGDAGPPPTPGTVIGTQNDGGTPISPWKEIDDQVAFSGGSATTPGGRASAGGEAQLVSAGAITIDKTQAAPSADVAPPDGAKTLGASDLAANVTVTGTTVIDGRVKIGGTDAERAITVESGDLYIRGNLRSADLGGTRQSVRLTATSGTVYIVGKLDTSGTSPADGNGQAGGSITIDAQRVVVAGALSSAGGDGKGTSSVAGGRGGDIAIRAGTDLILKGKVLTRGGAASATTGDASGGAAGSLALDAPGGIFVGGVVDGRGGLVAGAAAGATAAGAPGTLHIGTTVAPHQLAILSSSFSLDGGAGTSAGGKGGTLTLEARGGELLLAGAISVDGGDSAVAPGVGGTILGKAGHDAGTRLSGRLSLVGGAITDGGTGDGAEAGTLRLTGTAVPAPLTVLASGEVFLDGGDSGGIGVAGGGGHLYFLTQDGDISMAGKLWLRGGTARDPGGTGGLGGAVDIFCDANTDGFGGDLTIEPQGFIDASGGPGTIGGDGRNDGGWGIALFPQAQEQISVLLNSDGIHGTPREGVLLNLGTIITRGAAGNGWGGDVMFHGRGIDTDDPLPGHVEADAHGTGQVGQVGME